MLRVLFALAALASVAMGCFTVTVDGLDKDNSAELGHTLTVSWTATGDCANLKSVDIELWDKDLFFDDLILVVATGEESEGSFDWTVPYDTSVIAASETNLLGLLSSDITKADPYFRVKGSDSKTLLGKSDVFSFSTAKTYIYLKDVELSEYQVGAELSFTISVSKLPNRKIQCDLRPVDAFYHKALGTHFSLGSFTSEDKDYSRSQFTIPIPSVDVFGKMVVACYTDDEQVPEASGVMYKRITVPEVSRSFDLTFAEPVKANTDLTVTWTQTGLSTSDYVTVSLFRYYLGRFSYVAHGFKANGEFAKVSDGEVIIRVPADAETTSTTTYGLRAHVYTNRGGFGSSSGIGFRHPSLVTVEAADRGCKFVSSMEGTDTTAFTPTLVAGSPTDIFVKCFGFAAEVTADASLVDENAFGDSGTTVSFGTGVSVAPGVHKLTASLGTNMVPGWSWTLHLKSSTEDMVVGNVMVLNPMAGHCKPKDTEILCDPVIAQPLIAVTSNHALEVKKIDMSFVGVQCGKKFANFEVTSEISVEGQAKTLTALVSTYDGQPTASYKIMEGGERLDATKDVGLIISSVSYPEDRKSLILSLALEAIADAPRLALGTVKLTLPGLPTDCAKAVDDSDQGNMVEVPAAPKNDNGTPEADKLPTNVDDNEKPVENVGTPAPTPATTKPVTGAPVVVMTDAANTDPASSAAFYVASAAVALATIALF